MFSLNDILSFLSPISGEIEVLPIFFFITIVLVFLSTCWGLYKNANKQNWENNWEKHRLDIEQGSLSELSQNVATRSENAADIMPGIILIIGLLGTFIGLGLALDKASTILGSANMDNMDNSMGQLMSMMEGLGTKFKTSTWGLIAFLFLKWISGINNYDERRLNWVSNKIKDILNQSREEQAKQIKKDKDNLLSAISSLTETLEKTQEENRKSNNEGNTILVESMTKLFSELNTLQKSNHQENEKLLSQLSQQQIEIISTGYKELKELHNSAHSTLSDAIAKSFDKLISNQEKMNSENAKLFDKQHSELKEETNLMSNSLSNTFERSISNLLTQQLEHTTTNQENLTKMADRICSSIQIQQEHIIAAVDKNSDFLDKTAQESAKTRGAMDKFVNESLKTIENLKESASGMSKAAKDMGGSANKLQSVIDNLATEMNQLILKMKEELGQTISNMDKSFVSNMDKMTKDLNNTISEMNQHFKTNMEKMSEGLGQASKDISKAVNSLSDSVNKTMTNVTDKINESVDIQTKSGNMFTETAGLLNEEIIQMTQLVEQLGENITSGLKAISESNRNVISLNKRYNSSSEQIETLVEAVKKTSKSNQSLKPLLSDILQKIPNDQNIVANVNKILDSCSKLEGLLNLSLSEQKKQTDIQSKMNTPKRNEV
ncbi:hypothetical protein BKK49_04850 [Rodentibacter rarus]|uniref:hypothetical protein n=1 Tax=Rodentibacter rarus TaxID=1908260 RepID=UPI0009866315|nr:hypothetical protein [Rodentibacter rarus]OOF41470.1 hypothetical protein BKK49_04850 [Rodentibacter rarus]